MKSLREAKEIRKRKLNMLIGIILSLVIICAAGVYFGITNGENMKGWVQQFVGQTGNPTEQQGIVNVLIIVIFVLLVTVFLFVSANRKNNKN